MNPKSNKPYQYDQYVVTKTVRNDSEPLLGGKPRLLYMLRFIS